MRANGRSWIPGATIALALAAGGAGTALAEPVCANAADPACMDHVDDPQPMINDAAPGMLGGSAAPTGVFPKPAMKLRAKPPAPPAAAAAPAPPPAAEAAPMPADSAPLPPEPSPLPPGSDLPEEPPPQ